MSSLQKKIIIFILISVFVIISTTLAKVMVTKSDNEHHQYKPYSFTTQDNAELTVTKFIRALDNGDLRNSSLLLDQESEYEKTRNIIKIFCGKRKKDKSKRFFVIQPEEFVFNDSITGMFCTIKNLNKPGEVKQGMINVVKKENEWLIAPSSEFFEIIRGDKEKKAKQKLDGVK